MNTGNVIQIDMSDFDPDIDEGLPTQEHQETQVSTSITQQSFEKPDERFIATRCRRSGLARRDTL